MGKYVDGVCVQNLTENIGKLWQLGNECGVEAIKMLYLMDIKDAQFKKIIGVKCNKKLYKRIIDHLNFIYLDRLIFHF